MMPNTARQLANLSYQLAFMRKAASLTQAQLARKVNLSPAVIGKVEQGQPFSLQTLLILAEFFNVDAALCTRKRFIPVGIDPHWTRKKTPISGNRGDRQDR